MFRREVVELGSLCGFRALRESCYGDLKTGAPSPRV
jgi:hypothetical protein